MRFRIGLTKNRFSQSDVPGDRHCGGSCQDDNFRPALVLVLPSLRNGGVLVGLSSGEVHRDHRLMAVIPAGGAKAERVAVVRDRRQWLAYLRNDLNR